MSNIICIIDDHVTMTAPVVKGLVLYEKNVGKEVNDIKFKVCFVHNHDFNKSYQEGIDRLTKRMEDEHNNHNEDKVRCYCVNIKDNYDEYLECPPKFIDLVKKTAGIKEEDKVLYLLDLQLYEMPDDTNLNDNKECLSMKIYEWLRENGQHCKLFTTFHDEKFMEKWLGVYNANFKDSEEPKVFSRAFLNYTSFNMQYGEEIIDVLR